MSEVRGEGNLEEERKGERRPAKLERGSKLSNSEEFDEAA
jgi:hypothetical protein